MGPKDQFERAEWIRLDAGLITRLLKRYEGRDRIFVLTEIVRLCQRDLASRASSEYRLDFSEDEPPTNPDGKTDIGDRVTRKVDLAVIAEGMKEKKE